MEMFSGKKEKPTKKKLSIDNLNDGEIDQSLLAKVEVFSDLFSQLVDEYHTLAKKVIRLEESASEKSSDPEKGTAMASRMSSLEHKVNLLSGVISSSAKGWESADNLPDENSNNNDPTASERFQDVETSTAGESETLLEIHKTLPFYQNPVLLCVKNSCVIAVDNDSRTGKISCQVEILKPCKNDFIYLWLDDVNPNLSDLSIKHFEFEQLTSDQFELSLTEDLAKTGRVGCKYNGDIISFVPLVINFHINFNFD